MRTIIIPLLLIVLLGLISFNATNLMEYGQDLELAKTNKAATLKIFNDCQIKKCKSNTDPCSDKKCHD